VSAAAVTMRMVWDARPLIDGLEKALVAIEGTPIWDRLIAERGPSLVAAANDVVEATVDTEVAIGGAW
jgi:hypothetical protein